MGRYGREGDSTGFSADFRRALNALEEAVYELIASGWEERKRRRAEDLAVALADAAKASGWTETGGLVRSIASLLALQLSEVIPVRTAVREKLLGLLEQLKDPPATETA